MAGKNFTIIYGKMSKAIGGHFYYSAFLKEGTNDEIDEGTFSTHQFIGDAEQYAEKRQLSCFNSGDQAIVVEARGEVVPAM